MSGKPPEVAAEHKPSHRVVDFLGRKHGLMIGGGFRPALAGRQFATLNPATGSVLARVATGGAEDVDLAVTAAESAFGAASWRGLSPRERGRILWRISELIDARADELAELEALDNGMPLSSARGSVFATSEAFRYYSGWCTKLMGQTYDPSQGNAGILVYTRREPIGAVGLLSLIHI